MAKLSINFCVVVVMFALFALIGSASYDRLATQLQPKETELSSPSPPPPPPQPPTLCKKFTQLCAAYGAYTCCEGLTCTGTSEDLATANGLCLPIDELTPSPTKTCKQIHNLCQNHGEFDCCVGLTCVHPHALPPIGGIETKDLKLPPGIGVCEPIKL